MAVNDCYPPGTCHNEKRNTFLHPVTGQVPEENKKFDLKISALDMSNKAGGKRTATNSDISNHTMVSELPPERPSVRVSPAPKAGCQAGILGNVLACAAVSAGSKEQLRCSDQNLIENQHLDEGFSTSALLVCCAC